MHSHLRRLTSSEIESVPGETSYEKFATFGAVEVGRSGGDIIAHVCDRGRAGLPGEMEAESYDALHSAVKKNVLDAVWETTDAETGETVRRRGKMAEIPDGATVVETEIVPHQFA